MYLSKFRVFWHWKVLSFIVNWATLVPVTVLPSTGLFCSIRTCIGIEVKP